MKNGGRMAPSKIWPSVMVAVGLVTLWQIRSPASGEGQTPNEPPIVFSLIDDSTNDSNVYTVNPDGTQLNQVTSYPGTDHSATWSPDYSKLAFVSDRYDRGNNDIYVMDAEGGNVIRITRSPDIDGGPAWSPDSEEILFWRSSADGTWLPFIVTIASGEERPLPGGMQGDGGFDWSADGKVALTRNVGGEVGIYILDPTSGTLLDRFDGPGSQTAPSWRPQEGSLAFVSEGSVEVADNGTTASQEVEILNSGQVSSLDWGPDQFRMAYSAYDYESRTSEGAEGELHLVDTATGSDTEIPLPDSQRLLWGIDW
jgi:Tol biopolymer transport system component